MALAPLPPIPNTRLVDDPTRDAIWRRYLEQFFNRVTPLTNVHNDLSGLQGGTTAQYYHLTQAQHATVTSYLHNNLNGLQGGTAGEYYHLTAAQHSTVTSFGTFTNNRVLFTSPTSTITTSGDLTFNSATSTFAADLIAGNGLTNTRVIFSGASGLLSDSANLTFDGTILTVTGVVSVPDGSAAAPSIKIGDEQNGFFSSAASAIGGSLNGGQLFTWNTSGFTISISGGGADRRVQVINTSNTAGSGAKLQAQVAGTSAGDAYTQYNISGGINWAVGLDNSDSDSFKISQNATLGTNDFFTLTTGGNLTISGSITSGTLTSGRLALVGTAGLLTDDSGITYSSGVITATGFSGPLNGTVGATTATTGTFTTLTVNTEAVPDANDGAPLGTSSAAWSDLFLAEGGVINWDSGDVTITQTGDELDFAGAATGYNFDSNTYAPNFAHEAVTLNDDQAGYWTFSAADSRGIAVISGNVDGAGSTMVAFRVGSNIFCRALASGISAGAVATTTGALNGTTGTNGNLTLSVTLTATGDRLYIENRTGATRGYVITFLSLITGIPTGFTTI